MTHTELGKRMSSKEFTEWKIFYEYREKVREERQKEIDREAEIERSLQEAEAGAR